jgi:hypothetical protein
MAFRFTGKLNKLTLEIEPPVLTPADEKLLREGGQRNNEASQYAISRRGVVVQE